MIALRRLHRMCPAVERPIQRSTVIGFVSCVQGRIAFQYQLDDIYVSAVSSPMQCSRCFVFWWRGHVYAMREQELHNFFSSILACPCEAIPHLPQGCV